MGIKDLNKILRSNCVSAINDRPLSAYVGYRVAIDTSIFLYKFMYVYGNVVDGLVRLTTVLLKNGILPVYVLDGKPPKEKSDLLNDRKEKRDEAWLVVKIMKDVYQAKNENPVLTQNDLNTIVHNSMLNNQKKEHNINNVLGTQDWEMIHNGNVDQIAKYYEGLEKKIIQIKKEHIEDVKELMRLFGVPCIVAQSEAESLCAVLCKKGIVDAVLSEDMDVLATGGNVLLKNFTMEKGGSVTEVCLEGVLNELELSYERFLDMCILCGCDYTSKIGGIGPMHALKIMKKYDSIESAMGYMNNKFKVPSDFDYVTSRRLFKEVCMNDDFEKYKCDVLQTPILYNDLVKFIQLKAPKLKGRPLTDIDELSKEYKNEKKMNGKSNDNQESMLSKMKIKTTYQPKIDNYFNMANVNKK